MAVPVHDQPVLVCDRGDVHNEHAKLPALYGAHGRRSEGAEKLYFEQNIPRERASWYFRALRLLLSFVIDEILVHRV